MALHTYIHGEGSVKIWGISSRQRIERVLKTSGNDTLRDLSLLPENDSLLIFDGRYLFDDRLIRYVAATPNVILQRQAEGKRVAVAAHVSAGLAPQALEAIEKSSGAESLPGVKTQTLETLPISFQSRLRNSAPPFVLPISSENARRLERRLYDWSYKGVTDLITKYAWPVPALWAVRQCVRFGFRPNHVTMLGFVLVIVAGVLFARGQYGFGLLAGWVMTFLDTVDGKLARVTVTSSKFGHYFDHVIDIFHPPLWYILWGIGLATSYPDSARWVSPAIGWILIGYVAGRLTEGVFQRKLGAFGIFCWRPVDSYFRLITGRRNPNLILLTAGTLLGHPDLGLAAVAFWTAATSLFLLVRLGMAAYTRITLGPLQSWFAQPDQGRGPESVAVRIFTRRERLS